MSADRRIAIAKDKVDLVKDLLSGEDGKGPFKLQVDVLAFAASLGARRKRSRPLGDTAKDPIRQDIFVRQGYDPLFNLLAVCHDNDPQVLSDTDKADDRRATVFEEYANGGLEVMREELKGAVDYIDSILLMVSKERSRADETGDDFDLTNLLE